MRVYHAAVYAHCWPSYGPKATLGTEGPGAQERGPNVMCTHSMVPYEYTAMYVHMMCLK